MEQQAIQKIKSSIIEHNIKLAESQRETAIQLAEDLLEQLRTSTWRNMCTENHLGLMRIEIEAYIRISEAYNMQKEHIKRQDRKKQDETKHYIKKIEELLIETSKLKKQEHANYMKPECKADSETGTKEVMLKLQQRICETDIFDEPSEKRISTQMKDINEIGQQQQNQQQPNTTIAPPAQRDPETKVEGNQHELHNTSKGDTGQSTKKISDRTVTTHTNAKLLDRDLTNVASFLDNLTLGQLNQCSKSTQALTKGQLNERIKQKVSDAIRYNFMLKKTIKLKKIDRLRQCQIYK